MITALLTLLSLSIAARIVFFLFSANGGTHEDLQIFYASLFNVVIKMICRRLKTLSVAGKSKSFLHPIFIDYEWHWKASERFLVFTVFLAVFLLIFTPRKLLLLCCFPQFPSHTGSVCLQIVRNSTLHFHCFSEIGAFQGNTEFAIRMFIVIHRLWAAGIIRKNTNGALNITFSFCSVICTR